MRLIPLLLAFAVAGCGAPSILTETRTEAVALDAKAAAAAISRYRAEHGLGPVTLDSRLMEAASSQARAVARVGYLSHEVGGDFSARLAKVGFGGRYAAENLGAGAKSLDEALARWRASPEHNKNLLVPQAQRIGIARVDAPGSRYRTFWALVLSSS